MKPRQLLMGGALVLAAGLAFFGDKTPTGGAGDVAEAVQRAPAAASSGATRASRDAARSAPVAILGLIPRAALLGDSDEDGFAAGEGVFVSQNWTPPPPRESSLAAAAAAAPPPPPSAPPVPFTVLGKVVGDGVWEVFLARGAATYIVREHGMIDGQYRVERIAPPVMTITYLPLQQVQQLNIGVLD